MTTRSNNPSNDRRDQGTPPGGQRKLDPDVARALELYEAGRIAEAIEALDDYSKKLDGLLEQIEYIKRICEADRANK